MVFRFICWNLCLTLPIAIAIAICQVASCPTKLPKFNCLYKRSVMLSCKSIRNCSSVSATAASYPFSAIASIETALRNFSIRIVSNTSSSTLYSLNGIDSPSATFPSCNVPVTFFVFKTEPFALRIGRMIPNTSNKAWIFFPKLVTKSISCALTWMLSAPVNPVGAANICKFIPL